MPSGILRFELEDHTIPGDRTVPKNRTVLGFDTGLDNTAFAQAKMAQIISQNGFIVMPDGSIKPWKAEGVHELKSGRMVIWGPDFSGLGLDSLVLDPKRREQALEAVYFFLKARTALEASDEGSLEIFPGASGAIYCGKGREHGTFFFPPERLVRRSIEADGEAGVNRSQQWYHPDLEGEEAVVFTAAVMLYAVFSGVLPFEHKDSETLRRDIREGVFMPLALAAPGFDMESADLIGRALNPGKNMKRPSLKQLIGCLEKPAMPEAGTAGTRKFSAWFVQLEEHDKQKIQNEALQYRKKRDFRVKTKRFVIRNTAVIAACLAAVLAAGLFVHGYLRRLSERFNTIGLSPVEVAQSYYNAFNSLDHDIIDACIHGRNARNDINLVMNIFVITRARQAYEMTSMVYIPAQDWLDSGSPETDALVFGITQLRLQIIEETENEVLIRAEYNLWVPPGYLGEIDDISERPAGALSVDTLDVLKLGFINGAWRIIEIDRAVYRS